MGLFSKKDSEPSKVTSKNAFAKANAAPGKSPDGKVAYVQIHTNTEASHTWLTIKSVKDIAIDATPWATSQQKAASGPSAQHIEKNFETSLGFNKVGKDTGKVIEPDLKHTPEISKEFAINEAQYKAMFLYINSKRDHKWSNLGYNSTTFATHALKAANLPISSFSSTSGLAKQFQKDKKHNEGVNELHAEANDAREKLHQSPSKSTMRKAQWATTKENGAQKRAGVVFDKYDDSTKRLQEKEMKFASLKADIDGATKGNAIPVLKSLIKARDYAKWDDIKHSVQDLRGRHIISVQQEMALQDLYTLPLFEGNVFPKLSYRGPNYGAKADSESKIISAKHNQEFLDYVEIIEVISGGNIGAFISASDFAAVGAKLGHSLADIKCMQSPAEVQKNVSSLLESMAQYPSFAAAFKSAVEEELGKKGDDAAIAKHDEALKQKIMSKSGYNPEHQHMYKMEGSVKARLTAALAACN